MMHENSTSESWELINSTIEIPNASMNEEQLNKATYQLVNKFDQMADDKTANKVFSQSILSDEFVEIAWVGTLIGYIKKGIGGGYSINAAEKDALQQGKSIAVLNASFLFTDPNLFS